MFFFVETGWWGHATRDRWIELGQDLATRSRHKALCHTGSALSSWWCWASRMASVAAHHDARSGMADPVQRVLYLVGTRQHRVLDRIAAPFVAPAGIVARRYRHTMVEHRPPRSSAWSGSPRWRTIITRSSSYVATPATTFNDNYRRVSSKGQPSAIWCWHPAA